MALEEMGWHPERRESRIRAVPYVSIDPQESQNTLNALLCIAYTLELVLLERVYPRQSHSKQARRSHVQVVLSGG